MEFSINRITARNFKGCRELSLAPMGADLALYGDNGVGKTTFADMVSWNLFGKDSLGRSTFGIKPFDVVTGEPLHNLDYSVEIEYVVGGKILTLTRTLREDWVRQRGDITPSFTGNTTEYHINGVPVKAGEYDARVNSICPEERFRLLTDPLFFNARITWQNRRKALVMSCGDVTDADVIALTPSLSGLPKILGDHTPEDLKTILTKKRVTLNDELKNLPTRIDEATRSLPKVSLAADYSDAIATHQKAIRALQEKRAQAAAGGVAAETTKKIRTIEGDMIAVVNRLRTGVDDPRDEALREARRLDGEVAQAEQSLRLASSPSADASAIRTRLQGIRSELVGLNAQRDRLLAEWRVIDQKVFVMAEVCSVCEQPIPADRIESARGNFNEGIASEKIRINTAGGEIRARIDALSATIPDLEKDLESAENARHQAILAATSVVDRCKQARSALVIPAPTASVDPATDPEYVRLAAEKQALEQSLAAGRQEIGKELAAIDQDITEAEGKLRTVQEAEAKIAQLRTGEARIAELQSRQKAVGSEYEEVEGQLRMIEDFTKAKVALLTDKINSKFPTLRFQLFKTNINGGIEDCCEAMVNGVPYADLNHGSRINAGLEIINVLAAHYDFAPFVLIDNAESITALTPTLGQQIRLIVSASDRSLRSELSPRISYALSEGALF